MWPHDEFAEMWAQVDNDYGDYQVMTHPSYASMSQLDADNAGLSMDDASDKTAEEIQDEMVSCILQDVAELDGYTSPDDNPDLLQCTVQELTLILRRHICGEE